MFRWLLPGGDRDAVRINCKRAQLLKIKAQESSIWAKYQSSRLIDNLDDYVCVCYLT